MKTQLPTLLLFHLYASAQVYGVNAGFFDDVWTENDFKFLVVQVVVLVVSIRYLYKDENEKKPSIGALISIIILNAFAVALGYEYAIAEQQKVWVAMSICFAIGALANIIIDGVMRNAPTVIDKIAQMLPEAIGNKLKKMLS